MTSKHTAHIIIQAQTPLKVGSNNSDFLQDSPIQKDWNGLPMILGTSITGVLRKDFDTNKVNDIFGNENGSKIIISNALLLDEKENVNEGLLLQKSNFLKIFDNLPIREHTAINSKGVTNKGAKFDEEVVFKGTKFKFLIELIEDDEKTFHDILDLLASPSFRLGGGSTKGFGKFEIIEIKTTNKECSSSLNNFTGNIYKTKEVNQKYTTYTLKIKPDDFFMFGSGFGDDQADQIPTYEKVVDYNTGKLSDDMILIPASSIKGAIAHRTAFHYNKEMLKQKKDHTQVGEKNKAVNIIFGHKKELVDDKKTELGQKGKILISDCFKENNETTKVFDHVSIDRFTGGAIDSALFNEKIVVDDGEYYKIEILLHKDLDGTDEQKAFESSLTDITTGTLSLGGATTKGHGLFSGSWSK